MTTFAELAGPLALLQQLAAEHPGVPAPHVGLAPHSPNRLSLHVHGDLGVFEQWRDAIGIDFGTVQHYLQSGETTTMLSAYGVVDGVRIELHGYSHNVTLNQAVA